ncbi:MAG: DUF4230 domain-containing protein [Clostridia bacterium]|nr:DUF4230 domain-containing protein [Clostridia bacterium]
MMSTVPQPHTPPPKRRKSRLVKYLLRILCTTIALLLALSLLPAVKPFLQGLVQNKYVLTSTRLTHAMQEAGELNAVTYTDTGVAVSRTNALLVGTVLKVSIPYEYKIGFGFALKDVVLQAENDSITVYLPEIKMLHDSFTVTGEPMVESFLYELTEKHYQQILDKETLRCRNEYLESGEYQQSAWDAACKTLTGLFAQWSGEDNLPLTFVPKAEMPADSIAP